MVVLIALSKEESLPLDILELKCMILKHGEWIRSECERPEEAHGKGKKTASKRKGKKKNDTQMELNAAYRLKEKERAYEYIAD
jgi:hypothetical protein